MQRMRRVNELLKRELGQIFEREICNQVDCLVTVTGVKTSPDLRHATVFVSIYGSDEERDSVWSLLLKQRKGMQQQFARNVTLKYTPRLEFELDETAQNADRVSRLLDKLAKEENQNDFS